MAKIQGFFSEEVLDTVGINGAGSGACDKCGLASGCKTPHMGYVGKGQKSILIIAEAPSEADDNSGAPMMGETGQWFKEKLRECGLDLERDFWRTNAVGCHTTKVTKSHIKHCRPRVMKTISELKPKFIWLLGSDAIYCYYHERESNTTADRWRGTCIPDPDRGAWILPMYHPNYAMRMEKDDHFQATFDRDLAHAIKCSNFSNPPEHMSLKGVRILKNFDDAMTELQKVLDLRPEKLAFDYETTGLKPYHPAHRIASASFCYEYDKAYAFPYQYRSHFTEKQIEEIGDLWSGIMGHNKIWKIAHNSKFEDAWTREFFGIDITNMWWCSMNAAHILDNRTEFSGLKFQALMRWGIPDYDADIEKYLKNVGKTRFNRVMEAPLNDLLLYNGIDSLLTFRLQEEQEYELEKFPKMEDARRFFMDGLHTMCNIQENGIPMNKQYYLDQDVIIGKKIEDAKRNLYAFSEAELFRKTRGREINFASNTDLSDLFFKIMKLPSVKTTSGGNASVDASVLAELNTPIAKEITKISKMEKIKGTYIAQFVREIEEDGKLRPFFDLHVPVTYRGSSSNPNFQNIPVRDQDAMKITRGGIIPSAGNILDDWDYGSMEVRIIACITQCPRLMAYINDPTTDMHRDQAMDWFCFTKAEWDSMAAAVKRQAKDIRFEAKNGMVFALFYGSYFKSIANAMFPKLKTLKVGDITLFEHLRYKGIIRSLSSAQDDFLEHTKKVEKRFWDRFNAVKKWQEKAFASYLKNGYIEQMFGFRCHGWLTRNDICNYPVQGTAFHCLIWSINNLEKQMLDHRMKSKLIGQIHDCCLADVRPDEFDVFNTLSHTIATKQIRERFKWIIVPLDIEFEKTEIDMPWSTKTEFHPTFINL